MTRGRGSYGPLDRDQHFVIGWGTDKATDYVRDRTIGAALRPALPTITDALRAKRGASRWWTASRAIGGRAEAERPVTEIGQELFHTIADRDRALAQITTGFRSLVNDLAMWLTANPNHPDASANAQWVAADVTPTLEEWTAFCDHARRSWWTKLAISWETVEDWWDRLKQLRSFARAHGFVLHSVDPSPLPKTIWQRSAEGKGSEVTAVLGVFKIGVLTVLGVMGAVGAYSAIRSLRSRAHVALEREQIREVLREEMEAEKHLRKR